MRVAPIRGPSLYSFSCRLNRKQNNLRVSCEKESCETETERERERERQRQKKEKRGSPFPSAYKRAIQIQHRTEHEAGLGSERRRPDEQPVGKKEGEREV